MSSTSSSRTFSSLLLDVFDCSFDLASCSICFKANFNSLFSASNICKRIEEVWSSTSSLNLFNLSMQISLILSRMYFEISSLVIDKLFVRIERMSSIFNNTNKD